MSEFYEGALSLITELSEEGLDKEEILEILCEQLDEGSEEISQELYDEAARAMNRAITDYFGEQQ